MPIEPVRPGDPLKAEKQNRLIQQVNANARPGSTRPSQFGTGGMTFHVPRDTFIGLYELTEAMSYPDPPDETVPYVDNCNELFLYHSSAGEYHSTSGCPSTTLYHPSAFRDASGNYEGLASFGSGARVYAAWNEQSGRWEILAPPLDVWRFELKTALAVDDSATAYLRRWNGSAYAADTNIEFTLYDGMSTFNGAIGAVGYAKYFPDRGWEVQNMEC